MTQIKMEKFEIEKKKKLQTHYEEIKWKLGL